MTLREHMRLSGYSSFPAHPSTAQQNASIPFGAPEAQAILDAVTAINTMRNQSLIAVHLIPSTPVLPLQWGIDMRMNAPIEIDNELGLPPRTLPRSLYHPAALLERVRARNLTATELQDELGSNTLQKHHDWQGDDGSDISFFSEYDGVPF